MKARWLAFSGWASLSDWHLASSCCPKAPGSPWCPAACTYTCRPKPGTLCGLCERHTPKSVKQELTKPKIKHFIYKHAGFRIKGTWIISHTSEHQPVWLGGNKDYELIPPAVAPTGQTGQFLQMFCPQESGCTSLGEPIELQYLHFRTKKRHRWYRRSHLFPGPEARRAVMQHMLSSSWLILRTSSGEESPADHQTDQEHA